MDFNYTPINWESEGSEPSSSFKSNGYTAGQKLAANHVNFFVNFLMKAIAEIHTLLQTVATKTELISGLSGKADTSHTHSQYVTSTTLNSYATKASPTFTGTPKAPTPISGDDSTRIATTEFAQSLITENKAVVGTYFNASTGASMSVNLGFKPKMVLTFKFDGHPTVINGDLVRYYSGCCTADNPMKWYHSSSENGIVMECTDNGFTIYSIHNDYCESVDMILGTHFYIAFR